MKAFKKPCKDHISCHSQLVVPTGFVCKNAVLYTVLSTMVAAAAANAQDLLRECSNIISRPEKGGEGGILYWPMV